MFETLIGFAVDAAEKLGRNWAVVMTAPDESWRIEANWFRTRKGALDAAADIVSRIEVADGENQSDHVRVSVEWVGW